ncbi:hypothetical protein HRbin33_01653 [bacterium HR33]|nr:hypothetical protein HRbin33_01653 [bacterium HR33]
MIAEGNRRTAGALLAAVALAVGPRELCAIQVSSGAGKYSPVSGGTRCLGREGGIQIRVLVEAGTLGGSEAELAEVVFPVAGDRDVAPHTHGRVEVIYLLSGEIDHVVEGRTHRLRPGMVGIVRPGERVVHRVVSSEPARALIVWAPAGEADRIASRLGERPLPPDAGFACSPLAVAGESATVSHATARPEDVETLDAILAALYDVISGPAGVPRDWNRFRSLFLPEGRLIPAGQGRDGRPGYRVWTVEDYIAQAGPALEQRGFYEREIGRVTERFGNIAHVFTAYESRWTPEDPEPFQRGINSVQLYHDGRRWWIMHVVWDWERPGNSLPERYLRGGR